MRVIARYSHKGGDLFISSHHQEELKETELIIAKVNASRCRTKTSKEKTMLGRKLYSVLVQYLSDTSPPFPLFVYNTLETLWV